MQQASINLTQSLHEVYEPDWHGKDDIVTIGKDCDALWEDFHNKLVDSTLLNLDGYLQQFPDLKMRVAKRSRKLIDYDSARHQLESLQVAGMKNDRKAEDELKKAQKVFDELNVGLQDELPTLWDRRVGFYISTFKCVTSLEAKFHREISLVCRELYEVMTKLGEQHSDKIFTIQGAPSDSGPLRLARTPSPPEDETPPESPDASSNHMLRPVSPGPPRPKSPIQVIGVQVSAAGFSQTQRKVRSEIVSPGSSPELQPPSSSALPSFLQILLSEEQTRGSCGQKQSRPSRRMSGRSYRTAPEVYRAADTSCPPGSPPAPSADVSSDVERSGEAPGESGSRRSDTPGRTSGPSVWVQCRRHRELLLVWQLVALSCCWLPAEL
uniref:Amphiphysin-like n=1 Tax=Poecilia latipinna TaxID=48699 RepID=A0A3B3UNZ4_9TELE